MPQQNEVNVISFEGEALENLKTNMAKSLFAMTKAEAHVKGICINCQEPALQKCYSDAGREEYRISGMCELCFDEICGVEDEY